MKRPTHLSRRRLLAVVAATYGASRYLSAADARSNKELGSLILSGGGKPYNEQVLNAFWRLAGEKDARVVVVPTAHREMDAAATRPRRLELISSPWTKRGVRSLEVCHTLSRDEADTKAFVRPLREATAVWLGGGEQRRLLDAYRDTLFHRELLALYHRGGLIGGSSAGTAVMSQWTIVEERSDRVVVEPGFGFLSGTIVDQHFVARGREARLRAAIAERPPLVGIGVDEYTAAIIRGSRIDVVGASSVTVISPAAARRSRAAEVLAAGEHYDLADAFRE